MEGLAAGLTLSDRFQLTRRLGEGGMGEVWLAEDSQLKQPVALKILARVTAGSTQLIDLLRQECRKARDLVHPHIVRVYDFHTDGDWFFISMQYVEGENLAGLRGAPFQEIVSAALMVCDALDYAHRQGIVHRDIKPANILRDRAGMCCLTDFGIAGALASEPGLSDLRGGGSLPSSSPQQLDGAPAAVSDDVYGLGALLWELLSGRPLFHPDVTPARVREQVPGPVQTDGSGQPVPPALASLVAAMLDKSPDRRPAGMAAVRSVLTDVQSDYPMPSATPSGDDADGVIRPVSRRSQVADGLTGSAVPAPPPAARASPAGLPGRLVFGGLAALMLVAVGVIFFLPDAVQERRPVTLDQRPPPPQTRAQLMDDTGGPGPEASAAQRKMAEEVLGDLLSMNDRLLALGVELWGGADWTEARRLAEAGDEAYRARDYADALSGYRRALSQMQILEPRAAEVLDKAIREGTAALLAGDGDRAAQQFELALGVDGGNEKARLGLQRAMSLDEVLGLMGQASELENGGALADARTIYQKVLEIDPDWQPARDGAARTSANIARGEYETRMAAGYAAMAQGDYSRARSAFEAAARVRPGDANARAALDQLGAEERLQKVVAIQDRARSLEAQEQWAAAAEEYAAALAIDETLTGARKGLERSRARAELHGRLETEIGRAERFNDDKIWREANAVLTRARGIESPGPVLSRQAAELARLLEIAATPVPVQFQSDNLTDVVIYKVGRLGTFSTRTLDLRPGIYVAVGSRDGYRDVRRDFRVAADGATPPVVLRCEEPI
jgi:tetratricopeptide (TPR) repeat protein